MSLLLHPNFQNGTGAGRGLFGHYPYQKLRRNSAATVFPPTQRTSVSYEYSPTGGIVFAGTGPVRIGYVARTPTGGLQFAGSGPVLEGYVARTPTGGLSFGGDGLERIGYVARTPSGGLVLAGTGPVREGYVARAPSGGLNFNGTSPHEFNGAGNSFIYTPTGGIVFAGAADSVFTPFTPPTPVTETPYAGQRRWNWRYFR